MYLIAATRAEGWLVYSFMYFFIIKNISFSYVFPPKPTLFPDPSELCSEHFYKIITFATNFDFVFFKCPLRLLELKKQGVNQEGCNITTNLYSRILFFFVSHFVDCLSYINLKADFITIIITMFSVFFAQVYHQLVLVLNQSFLSVVREALAEGYPGVVVMGRCGCREAGL